MIPLSIKEMRETSRANVYKLVENRWNDSCVLDLEVHRGLTAQAQDFLQQKSSAPLKDRIDGAENQTTVAPSFMLG